MKKTNRGNTSAPDTLLIFERPELYFFPALPDIVCPAFGVPQKSLRYLVYKALCLLHLPGTHLFWGSWTKRLAGVKRVVIFDYGYQRGMERYIRRKNPDCAVYLFFWNLITPVRVNHRLFSDKRAIYSTDPGDCARYRFHYNSIFYTRQYRRDWSGKKNRLFFIGHDKGRAGALLALKQNLTRAGISCDIRIVSSSRDASYIRALGELYSPRPLSYDEYLQQLEECDILLDFNQKGQRALTMRVMEAIFLSKKLITNNAAIQAFDFYSEDNILLLPDDPASLTQDMLRAFLEKPFVPYPQDVIDYYDFHAWKERFVPGGRQPPH